MKSKKAIMGLAAILILIFHFYIPVTAWSYEKLLMRISYVGVDLFFFVSAYSLSKGKIYDYFEFIKKRFSKIYFRYIVLVGIAVLFAGYSIKRAFRILTGIEFFKRGGGSFLWFVIAILITYIWIPFAKKLKEKYNQKGLFILFALWGIIGFVFQYVFNYTTLFIYINRLPIIFIGLYYDELNWSNNKNRTIIDAAALALSMVLLFKFGATVRLNRPFNDFFYVLAIPFVLAVVDLFESIYENHQLHFLSFVGNSTLEIYGLQMVFGVSIVFRLQKLISNDLVVFLLTSIVLIALATILNKAFLFIEAKIKK